jgi:hypothetical protein
MGHFGLRPDFTDGGYDSPAAFTILAKGAK